MNTAILTGPSSGIGEAITSELIKNGWRVVGLYHGAKPTTNADAYQVDLSDLQATTRLGERLAKELPTIDAFVHIAGIWHDENAVLADKQLEAFTPEQIIATMNVGITSAMLRCSTLLPSMKSGTVIGISGTFTDGGAGWLPYYVSKRALEDFLVGLSQDYIDTKVFGISPADTATPAYQKFYPQYLAESQPPQAIAELAIKMLSGESGLSSGDIVELRDSKTRKAFHG